MPLYELKNIAHQYNGHLALSIDHWVLESGRITGLSGPNGSGKSTLLKLLGFVERPTSGQIFLNGRKTVPFDAVVRETVALLPQATFLLKRSVYHNVEYGLRLRGLSRLTDNRVREAMSLVGLDFDHFAHRPWYALSGGEAHRVALAARLALRPKVLLLDEPTTSVDAASAQHIKSATLYAHQQWGSSVVIVSHEHQWLHEISHEILYLFQGKLLGSGHRTLLFGPWLPADDRKVYMLLIGEQRFEAPHPPPEAIHQVAAIAAIDLSILPHDNVMVPAPGRLQGTLTSMSLERITGRIHATVGMGSVVFHVVVPPEIFNRGGFTPGSAVWISYQPDDVVWY